MTARWTIKYRASPIKTKEQSRNKLPELIVAVGREPSGDKVREQWWTRKGSVRYLFDEDSLEAAIRYTLEAQDEGGSKFDE